VNINELFDDEEDTDSDPAEPLPGDPWVILFVSLTFVGVCGD